LAVEARVALELTAQTGATPLLLAALRLPQRVVAKLNLMLLVLLVVRAVAVVEIQILLVAQELLVKEIAVGLVAVLLSEAEAEVAQGLLD
jgi:hypothetical protein